MEPHRPTDRSTVWRIIIFGTFAFWATIAIIGVQYIRRDAPLVRQRQEIAAALTYHVHHPQWLGSSSG